MQGPLLRVQLLQWVLPLLRLHEDPVRRSDHGMPVLNGRAFAIGAAGAVGLLGLAIGAVAGRQADVNLVWLLGLAGLAVTLAAATAASP